MQEIKEIRQDLAALKRNFENTLAMINARLAAIDNAVENGKKVAADSNKPKT